jgi:16S rRNA (cytosine1402-N4)-methyltransferase
MSGHVPVLVHEVLQWLQPSRGGVFVDCTVGLGGHTRALLDAGATRVVGFDRDAEALALARDALAPYGTRVEFVHADFRSLGAELDLRGTSRIDGLVADLGVSSMQIDNEVRGFSFKGDAPLDMRMDRSRGPTAAELLREVSEEELADVIFGFGEERFSRRIARAIVHAREVEPVTTTGQLASLVRRAVPRRGYERIDPATRTFQALRIWVNGELEGLGRFTEEAAERLRRGARLAIIAFHSLEDRVIKHTLRELDRERGVLRVLTRRPLVASDVEVAANPRARSAKLRVAERM